MPKQKKINLKKHLLKRYESLPQHLKNLPIFLAISGGKDSTTLAKLAFTLKDKLPRIHLIHVNYRLRQPQSDQEECFLREWAKKEKVSIFVKRLNPQKAPSNLQAWARRQRYQFFARIIKKSAGGLLWLAHHQQDQAETILMRLLRGSGLKALGGMKELEVLEALNDAKLSISLLLFRPFLGVPIESIYHYLEHHQIKYFEDQSNQTLTYLRNRIRHQVFPLLLKENFQMIDHLCQFGKEARHAQEALQVLGQKWLAKHRQGSKSICLPAEELSALPLALQETILGLLIREKLPHYQGMGKVVRAVLGSDPYIKKNIQLPLPKRYEIGWNSSGVFFKKLNSTK